MARQHKDKAGLPQKSRSAQLKAAWRKATHDKKQVQLPGEDHPRTRLVKRPRAPSLKAFARAQQAAENETGLLADAWSYNKHLNSSAPNRAIGRTRKRLKPTRGKQNCGGDSPGKQKRA